jgi:hypothetical protein
MDNMVEFTTTIKKFAQKGDKTGWTYIEVSADLAEKLIKGNKRSFKVKGKLDQNEFEQGTLLPMGEGDFILALNAALRKLLKKQKGDSINVILEVDHYVKPLSFEFMICLEDEPAALSHFKTLPKSHQKYFSKWIESAKTDLTKEKRIIQSINALALGLGFSEMIRMNKKRE